MSQNYILEFTNQKKRFKPFAWAFLAIVAEVIFLPILLFFLNVEKWIIGLVVASALFGFVPIGFFWYQSLKCPNCKSFMGKTVGKYCPLCGAQIQE